MNSRKVQTRWGAESAFSKLTSLSLSIAGPMTNEQIDAYVLNLRIEEITQKLEIGVVVPSERRRSPSPEPMYDSSGRRVNMRHRRIPGYRAPQGYRYNRMMIKEKVYIPDKQFPEFNFIGQILGSRGRSLANMNARSGANIVIRGRGSTKEGRRGPRQTSTEDNEPLHCLITADSQEKVDNAKKLVETVIETVITIPEHANERKKEQLCELAKANGTFRDDERCNLNTISTTTTDTFNVICRICGNGGHIASDCPNRKTKSTGAPWRNEKKIPPWRQQGPNNEHTAQDEQDIMCTKFLEEI
ncbi:eukaryotic type KH-domain (KH-domain type I) [Rostrohypoxylon terebratum]|nr:eukaryotic type KH-domain (KH-domain type I) [Rostrohypoxylon terebratum]